MITTLLQNAIEKYHQNRDVFLLLETLQDVQKVLLVEIKQQLATEKPTIVTPAITQRPSIAIVVPIKEKVVPRQEEPVKNVVEKIIPPEKTTPLVTENEKTLSLNEQMESQLSVEIHQRLDKLRINDITTGIDTNTKFVLIQELFDHNADNYTKSMATLNQMQNLHEATEWIKTKIIQKQNLPKDHTAVEILLQLVQKRFVSISC